MRVRSGPSVMVMNSGSVLPPAETPAVIRLQFCHPIIKLLLPARMSVLWQLGMDKEVCFTWVLGASQSIEQLQRVFLHLRNAVEDVLVDPDWATTNSHSISEM